MNEIKLFIFDLDGTLYCLNDVVAMNYQMQLDFYMAYIGKSKDETVRIFENNNIFPIINEKSKSATEFFLKTGIQASEWNNYRESHFNCHSIKKSTSAKEDIIRCFANLAPLVLLSSNSQKNIEMILDHIGIDIKIFDETICSDANYAEGVFNKKREMQLLAERKGILCSDIFSIGDRYKTDVEPLVELGGHGAVIKTPDDLIKVYRRFN